MNIYLSRTNRIFFIFIIVIAPLVFYKKAINTFDIPQALSHYIIIILYFISLILFNKNNYLNSFNIKFLDIVVTIFIFFNIISILYIKSFTHYYIQIISLIFSYIVFIVISKTNLINEKNLILNSFVIISLICSIIGIAQYFFGFDFIPQVAKPSVTFGNRNTASQLVSVTIPIAIYFFILSLNKRRKIHLIFYLLVMSLNILFILITKTRSSLLAILLFLIFFTLFNLEKIKENIKIVILVVVLLSVSTFFIVKMSNNEKNIFGKGSLEVRKTLWLNSTGIIKDNLFFGVGVNQFRIYYPKYHKYLVKDEQFSNKMKPNSPHNEFIQAFVELGLIGFISFLTILIITIIYLFKLLKVKKIDKNLTISLFGSIIIYIVIFNFSFLLKRHIGNVFFFIILGIINNIYTSHNNRLQIKISSNILRVIFIIGVVMASTFSYYLVKYIIVDQQIKSIYSALYKKDYKTVLQIGENIMKENPYRKEINLLMSYVYYQNKDFNSVEVLLLDLLNSDPYNSEALYLLKDVYLKLNNVEKHNIIQKKLSEIHPIILINNE